MGIAKIALIFLILQLSNSSQSPYLGHLQFDAKDPRLPNTALIRPLSEQPKIANIQTNIIKIIKAEPFDGCRAVKRVDPGTDAVLLLMDGRSTLCGLMRMHQYARQSGSRGVILITDDETFVKSHCNSFADSLFFTAVIDTSNYTRLPPEVNQFSATLSITLIGTQKSLIQIWTSSLNLHSYEVLSWFNQTMASIPEVSNKIMWRTRMALVGCTQNGKEVCNLPFLASCACSGEYCNPQLQQKTPQILVRQDIRQEIIQYQHRDMFFSYISLFREKCLQSYINEGYVQGCASSIMQQLSLPSLQINTMIDEMLQSCQQSFHQQSYLQSLMEMDKLAFRNYNMYPLFLFNKEIINMKSQSDMKAALCRKLSLQNRDGCLQIVQSSTTLSKVTSVLFYVVVISVLIAIGITAIICFKNKFKRELNKEARMQVQTAVDNYFALTETTSKKEANSSVSM